MFCRERSRATDKITFNTLYGCIKLHINMLLLLKVNVVHYQHVPEHHNHTEHQQQQRPVVLVLKVWYVTMKMSFMNLHKKGFHIPVAGGAPPARPSRKQSRSHSNLLLSRSISPSAPSSGSVGETIRKLQN